MNAPQSRPRDSEAYLATLREALDHTTPPASDVDSLYDRAARRRQTRHRRLALGASAATVAAFALAVALWPRSDPAPPIAASSTLPVVPPAAPTLAPGTLPAGWELVEETHITVAPSDFTSGRSDTYVLRTSSGAVVRVVVEPDMAADLAEVAERFGGESTTVRGEDAVMSASEGTVRLVWNEDGRTAVTIESDTEGVGVLRDVAEGLRSVVEN